MKPQTSSDDAPTNIERSKMTLPKLPDPALPLITRISDHNERLAIVDVVGKHAYHELLAASTRVGACLLDGRGDLQEARIAFLVPPGFEYVTTLLGIWLAGGIAVPLCTTHPLPEIEYVIGDTGAECIVVHPTFAEKLTPLARAKNLRLFSPAEVSGTNTPSLPAVDAERRALILYTSGTTSKPKGVVLTHGNITAQMRCLIEAWGWTADDRILHVLPLHHTHGIVNILLCALWAGAVCEMLPKFDATLVWQRFVDSELTLFMAVPTIYVKLISAWEKAAAAYQNKMSAACAKIRLMVSGSAALPVPIFEKWREITGHTLLERYGMTEIGMALSNPLHGERRPGFVGKPLPGVAVRLVDERGEIITAESQPGEIQVAGPAVFRKYWGKPDATRAAFRDGWFITGDVAQIEGGDFRILGRSSVDIIKAGGYKLSALEIEHVLSGHPAIAECAVVGVPDAEWGERVCAAAVLRPGSKLLLEDLRLWAGERLAKYKLPTGLTCLEALPRNAMGKVTKPEIKRLLSESGLNLKGDFAKPTPEQ